jgi:hypothetical protein
MPGPRTRALAAVAGLSALVACGGSSAPAQQSTTSNSASSATGAASGSAGPVKVTLSHVPHGSATLTFNATAKTLTVEIKLVGLTPSSTHPAHIHTGSCAKQGGVVYGLTSVVADATGVADSTTTVKNVTQTAIPDATWYVNIHNGPNLTPDVEFQPLVCGDVANPSGATSVNVSLTDGPTPPPGSVDETASGTATLSIVNGALQVVINATGLAPGGSHAAHIHMGSCEKQGKVLYPLNSVVADSTGKGTSTTTVNGVTSIPSGTWYVNVHRSTMLVQQYDFDPILCGDVTGPGY